MYFDATDKGEMVRTENIHVLLISFIVALTTAGRHERHPAMKSLCHISSACAGSHGVELACQ